MSISTYQPRADFIGTGVLDSYSFDFKITDKSQLLIVKADDAGALVWAVDGDDLTYLSSVTFNEDGGGQVVLIADLEADYTLAIILNANEPTQPQQFARRSSWTLKQFEDAFDYMALQLQAVAYLAKRAPILGKLVNANDADAFNMEIELLADAVIAINSTGDGFEAVARSAFVGETGPAGSNGSNGSNGADGSGILRAGNDSLSDAQSSVTVVFSTPTSDANYVPNFNFVNLTDAVPIMMQGMVTGKTVNGFTVTFGAPTDSANYLMSWQVNDAI